MPEPLNDTDEFEPKRRHWDDDWEDHWHAHVRKMKEERARQDFHERLTWAFVTACWVMTVALLIMKVYA